jgi:hypothetical protein
VAINSDSDKLREFLHARIAKRKKRIHLEHSARFNHDMQLQIDCIEWVLEKIEVNKIPNDRLDGNIRSMIKNLEKRKDKAMIRSDTDDIVGGSNHMFGDLGDDVLKGGENSGPNYFDCGDGFDAIVDFNLARGDVTAGNCENF